MTAISAVARGCVVRRVLRAYARPSHQRLVRSATSRSLVNEIDVDFPCSTGVSPTRSFSSLSHDVSSYTGGCIMGVLAEVVSRIERPTTLRPSKNGQSSKIAESVTARLSLEELVLKLCLEYPTLPLITSTAEDGREREKILEYLSTKCIPDPEQVSVALQNYQKHVSTAAQQTSQDRHVQTQRMSKLRHVCTPPYERLFQCLLEEDSRLGMAFLVCLRKDLRELIRWRQEAKDENVVLMKELDSYLRDLLSTWFSPGMLEIRRLSYNATPAEIIEKLATKELVHPIKNLDDLRSRLGPDRRVFAAFHPLLPEEPLVFCHAALRSSIPSSMEQVMNSATTEVSPQVAAFYSIFSTKSGLAGIDLGRFVLKEAMKSLGEEFPTLETFSTLSPMPRFRKWLEEKIIHNQGTFQDNTLFSEEELSRLQTVMNCHNAEDVPKILLETLKESRELETEFASAIEPILLKLAARYLVLEKRHGKPLDGVARFHIANGAEMFRLNFMADTSRKGWHNSFGVMVNYRYEQSKVEENQARHEKDFFIPVCVGVSKWLPRLADTEG